MNSSRNGSAPALVLFDIDGTLTRRAGMHHRDSLVAAVRRVTGLESTTEGIPLHGMLDPEIIARMMRNAGASAAEARDAMPEVLRYAQIYYLRGCPNLQRKVCPGVRRLLRRLDRLGVPMGLVTGNLARIGWKKVERAGLKPYFRFGAFAGMSSSRAGLARWAIRHARSQGWINRDTPVSLIGDTAADIRAAKANGIRSVAVATGLPTRDELSAEAPDVLVNDLRELDVNLLLEARTSGWRR